MAGLAVSDDFMLSTATVMIGARSALFDLNPTTHGIGLVKNFTISSNPTFTELSQGVKNTIVASVMTANPTTAQMEVYEYTAKNLAYGLALDGTTVTAKTTVSTVSGAVTSGATSLIVTVSAAAGFAVGDWVLINVNNDDDFIVRKISAINTGTKTLTFTQALPAIADLTPIKVVNALDIGTKQDQNYLSAKVAGKLADGTEMVILMPKIRITKGFSLGFSSDNFANLPFEFTLYDMASSDSFYSEMGGAQAKLIRQ